MRFTLAASHRLLKTHMLKPYTTSRQVSYAKQAPNPYPNPKPGYSPDTWLSMAGQHAHLGLPYVFDATPWVHLLGNGAPHTFSIQIGNSNANFW